MPTEAVAGKPPAAAMSGHADLKARTRFAHAAVDAAFSRFDLTERGSYVAFLRAHARVLPGIERALRHGCLPRWQPRTGRLAHDLGAYGHDLPVPFDVGAASSLATQFGLLYVLEGSRLGARLLLRRVQGGFSVRFLSAVHEPGAWRAFTASLDARAEAGGPAWLEEALGGALYGFQLYADAAEEVLAAGH